MDALVDAEAKPFALSMDQRSMRDMVEEFAAERLAPHAREWDEKRHLPLDVIRETAGLGMGGVYVREDVGGSGLSRLDAAVIFEALSKGCVDVAAFITIHNMAAWMIDTFGSAEQRARFLPDLTSMRTIASYALTEPGSGSDAAAMRTKAVRDGDDYVLTGTKQFISGAGVNDLYVVMARTDEGSRGVTSFVLEKGMEGLSFGPNERKMGWHIQPTAQLVMDGVRVPAANRLADEGMGFRMAMAGLDGGRLNIAACSLGGAQAAFDKALDYSRERQAFGQPIGDFQGMEWKLADMATELEASRALLYTAAARLDAKAPDATKFCAMAKRFVTDTCSDVANGALQVHGGYGYLAEYGVEKIVRDLRVHQILEGTNEIMRHIVARHLKAA